MPNYINYNQVKHGLVHDVEDWIWSTYHKYIKEELYGRVNDFEQIENINTKRRRIRTVGQAPPYQAGKWGHHCELPDGVKLPYYVLVNSSEGLDYLINICSIETTGIKITYRKLSADESELFRLPEKIKK